MGQLVLGAVGAIAGFAIGGPIGASIGWSVGALAGSLLFPTKVQGPRLQDTKVQGAEYGTMRPILFGTMRIGGTGCGQGSTENGPNKFTEHEHKSGGKGGPETTEFSYSLSFFDEICEGPIVGVRKRWANGRLITDEIGTESSDAWPFVLYLGDTTQEPDPTMETVYGVGEVTPMRGVAYESHEELNLTPDYQNVRPNVEYEAYTKQSDLFPYRIATFDAWQRPAVSDNGYGATYKNGIITATANGNTAATYIFRQFTVDGTQIGSTVTTATTPGNPAFSIRNLNAIILPNLLRRPDPDVLGAPIDTIGTFDTAHFEGNSNIYIDPYLYTVDSSGPPAVTTIGRFNCAGGIPLDDNQNANAVLDALYGASAVRLGSSDTGDVYVMVESSGDVKLWKFDQDLSLIHFWDVAATTGTQLRALGNFHVHRNQIIFKMIVGPLSYVGMVAIDPDSLILSDVGTPMLSDNSVSQNFVVSLGGCLLMDEMGTFSVCPPPAKVILGEDIVAPLLRRAGLDDAQFDVSDLTQEVRGYLIASQMTVHNAIDTLRKGFFFDMSEWDGKVYGINRGHDPVATIPDGDLGAHEPGSEAPEPLETTRTPEAELPRTVFVNYYDADKDYQRGSQYWRRQVTASETDVTLDLPIVLTADEALQIAQWHMHFAWLEREQFSWSTTRKWSALTPTDVVIVRGRKIRITTKTESPNGLIKFDGVLAFAGPYTPYDAPPDGGQSGAPGSGQPGQETPQTPVASQLVLLDIPYCSPGGTQFGFVAAMGRATSGVWPGATLYKSLDAGTTYAAVASTAAPNTIGASTDALDDYAGDLADVDEVSTVEIVLTDPTRTLSSCTPDALDNGANLCALGVDGGWELLQFRDATLTAPGTYTLTGFYRGRNGTDAFISTHAAGDTFVLLPATAVNAPQIELNVELSYKAVTFGAAIADATSQLFTNTGLAPAQCMAEQIPFVGDGGTPSEPAPGIVPAPEIGDCAAGKFLSACGTWEVPPNDPTPTGTGFRHVTSGVEDGTAIAVDLSGAHATGTLAAGRFPALTGDVTTSAGSLATTLASTITAAGPVGDSTHVAQVTFDAKGRLTTVSSVAISGTIPPGDTDYILLRDEKTSGTGGGNSSTGINTRVLNTEVSDTGNNCSLSSNQFTLTAGTYRIRAKAPTYNSGRHRARLRNVTDGVTVLLGTSEYGPTGDHPSTSSWVEGIFTIGASKALELQHYQQTGAATVGLGVDASSGETEVYAVVELWKLS